MSWRILGTSIAVALVACFSASLTTAAPLHLGTKAQWRANRRHAARVAIREVTAVELPAGSRRVRHLVAFDDLRYEVTTLGSTVEVVRRRSWVVPGRPAAVIDYLQKSDKGRFHAPRGGGSFDLGFFSDEPEPELDTIESNRREGRGVVESTTTVTVTPLRHRRSGVEIEATAVPVRPRPAAERVPSGVTRIRVGVTTRRGGKSSLVIRSRRRISRLSRLADRLRVDQAPEPCEEEVREVGRPQPPVVRLAFESAPGRVLAEASQRAGNACAPMRFTVRGSRMPALQNGDRLLRAVLPERRRLASRDAALVQARTTISRQRENERAAVRRATQDVRAAVMPPGSRQVDRLHGRAGKALATAPFTLGTQATVSRHRLWIVPREPRAAFRWIGRHLTGRYVGGGSTETVNYRIWERAGDRHLLGSMLTVSAIHDGHGQSAVRLDALAIWLSPRPAAEHVPARTRKIAMRIVYVPLPEEAQVVSEEGIEPAPPSNEGEVRSLTITRPRQVTRLVRLVDGLRVVQPREISCPGGPIRGPGEPLPGTVHLRFESSSGATLAEAIQSESAGVCEPMKFAVGGEWMSELEGGGEVIEALEPLIARAKRTHAPNPPPRL